MSSLRERFSPFVATLIYFTSFRGVFNILPLILWYNSRENCSLSSYDDGGCTVAMQDDRDQFYRVRFSLVKLQWRKYRGLSVFCFLISEFVRLQISNLLILKRYQLDARRCVIIFLLQYRCRSAWNNNAPSCEWKRIEAYRSLDIHVRSLHK